MPDGAVRPPRPVQAKDVALRVGVSTAAVSMALNGRPGLSDATRERILQAARELGFRPNQLAKALRTGRSGLLALVVPDVANPFYTDLAHGVILTARAKCLHVIVAQSGLDAMDFEQDVSALLDHRCSGMIFTALTESMREVVEGVLAKGVPFVQLIRRLPHLPADFVGSDEITGGASVADHLFELGHRHLAVISGPPDSSASLDRLSGLIQRLRDLGVHVKANQIVTGDLSFDSGCAATETLLAQSRDLPTAICCGNDLMALGVIQTLEANGFPVPGHVSVTGYDGVRLPTAGRLTLTTVSQPHEAMGGAAVRVLNQRLSGSSRAPEEKFFPTRLIVGGTTAAPRSLG